MTDTGCSGGCACANDRSVAGGAPAVRAGVTRRGVLAGTAAVAALALGACASSDEASSAGASTTDASTPTTEPPTDAATDSATAQPEAGATGEVLATTGEFPTGGGAVVTTASGVVVVTQPADGEFKAFNGKCPHQGCPVSEVLENTIICNCHGSVFDAQTGDRLEGPAPVGLEPVAITVSGDQILLA